MTEHHRILRVLEYTGTPDFTRDAIERRAVKGERILGNGVIREAVLGETPEVLKGPPSVMELIANGSAADREELFGQLRTTFCMHCGVGDPRCTCIRDE